ncbi:MAG: DDE-type integrase/transposase/recombinase [Blastochloris sp.]|nr:DDE-type integrase/transposase/recombinase [Blastochloris sp.]
MSQTRTVREQAIHLLRAGQSSHAVAQALGRSESWVRRCRQRYQEAGWAGLAERSRAPHQHGTQLPEHVRTGIVQARSALEAAAARATGLKYIGARAIRTSLHHAEVTPLPSIATIERVLQDAELTRPNVVRPTVQYPHLRPQQPLTLIQIDLVPHCILGGPRVFCFNSIDVVSRYPAGQAYLHRRARDAVDFLRYVMQTVGIATSTQVDNEGCFSGGATHPYVLGQCARMALQAGTELVFSPVRHPQSNSFVERFHQEYQRHVWQDTYLADLAAVHTQADAFFADYRHSRHHRALAGASPAEVHARIPPRLLPPSTASTAARLPITAGRLHFLRRVTDTKQVSVLNVLWDVPTGVAERGVWVTVDLAPAAATLTVYDAAPDAVTRQCLARYPFPVHEPVIAREPTPPARPAPTPSTRLAQVLFAPVYLGAALIETLLGQSRPTDQTVPP